MTVVSSESYDPNELTQAVVTRDVPVEVRDRLRGIFASALSLAPDELADDRPFLEIATSSLALVDAIRRVSDTFRIRPSLRRVFEEFGTIDRLAQYVVVLMNELPARETRDGRAASGDGAIHLELTAAQEQLVFLTDLRPSAAAAWYETIVVELEGALRIDALRAALKRLSEKHDGLRARLSEDRKALRVDLDPDAIELVVHDLLPTPETAPQSAAAAWLREDVSITPQEALVRVDLARLGPACQHHLLRITVHGLVADRTAVVRLVEELGLLYTAERGGDGASAMLPATAFAAHQRAEAAAALDPRRADLAEFWRAKLTPLPVVDLPADRSRSPIKRYAGDCVIVPLDTAQVERTRDNAGGIGAFLHVVSAVAAWAARLSGQEDILLGVFAQPPDASALLANRTNPLPLRVPVDGRASFTELKRRVSAAFLDAVDHGELPFAEIVRVLNPERDQSRSAIFTLAVDREAWPDVNFGDLSARIITAPSRHARYDMQITLVEGPGFAHLRCDYSTELFEAKTVRRYLGCLRRLLDATLSDPQREIGALPLLSPEDRNRILFEWNRTELASPDEPLFARIDRQALRTPDADAIVDGGRRLTYAELLRSANRVANRLRDLGVKEETRVAILMDRSLEAIVAMVGVLKAGGAYVPIDPEYPPARVEYMLADAGAIVVITDKPLLFPPPDAAVTLTLSRGMPELASESPEPPGVEVRGDALAYLVYTSGSTGRPKGAAIEHRCAVNFISWARTQFDDADLAGVLASTSFCFDLSIFEIFVTLSYGGTVILSKNLLDLLTLPARDRVTLINSVSSAVSQLLEVSALPASVRVVNFGGEAVHQDVVNRIHALGTVRRTLDLYGPVETTTYSTIGVLEPGDGPPLIGRPIGNTRVYVLDARDEPVPPGVTGQLCIAGAGVARGYFRRPDLTARAFVTDPFVPGERMYRTGDLARYRDDGQLEFLGRRDHQVKVRGFRIELGEIEACLMRHPSVREAAVLAVGTGTDRRIVAWTVRAADFVSPHAPDLRAYVLEHLPPYMAPARFVSLPALPRLPNGKVDRSALPAPDMGRESRTATEYAPPATDLERTLAGIWATQLGVERLGRDDNFFELGGHSLLLAPIMLEIGRRLGLRVTLSEFFDAPTVAKLAARLHELGRYQLAEMRLNRRIVRTGPLIDAHFDELRADAVLDASLEVGDPAVIDEQARHLFVTGVTGFVGVHVFQELLRRTDARFACMVRCANPSDGIRRIVEAMKREHLWDDSFAGRFDAVPGELTRPRLGISEDEYHRLARSCDSVMHLAAQVNFIYPYRALKAVNVGGVHEVLRFCFADRTKPLHYMSTAAVWPMGAKYRFREDDDINHGIRLNLGYDESKWVAEHLIGEARQRGLPVTVYRPGEVSGHSVTGRCVLDHFMFAIMKGSFQMKVFPDVKCMMDMAPVDYVAAAFAVLSMDPRAAGGTYHLNNPRPCEPAEILKLGREYGYSYTIEPMEQWVATLLARADLSENALYPFAAVLEEFEEENLQFPVYDTTRACAALAHTGVECPPVAAPLIRRYLDWFIDVGFLEPPPAA